MRDGGVRITEHHQRIGDNALICNQVFVVTAGLVWFGDSLGLEDLCTASSVASRGFSEGGHYHNATRVGNESIE